jgi:hypothetical protein
MRPFLEFYFGRSRRSSLLRSEGDAFLSLLQNEGDMIRKVPQGAFGGVMATSLDQDRFEGRFPNQGEIVPALEGLRDSIAAVCPNHAIISFRFDGKLHVDIDTRRIEEASMVELALLSVNAVEFNDIRRAKAPSAFLHRVTAEILA